ncbi:uncharacterized protein N7518_010049 [Penicillium psychrosexuale]|uniref:uncharacterized protein n=1 Tax=Penicillium psychrosexuale TaxID=1002107 RepID=UPI0025452207|nr:uncharacterized protein N7518_010049 [Penicillium psychrosexuale]KAJ5781566.1 hypothetical protein N7518_010049 [Penicillium psychrosexuale]
MVRPTSANELVVVAGSFALITKLPMNEGLFGEGTERGVAGFLGSRAQVSRGPDSGFGGYAARCQPMYEEAPRDVSRIESCHESFHESEQDRDHDLQLTELPPWPHIPLLLQDIEHEAQTIAGHNADDDPEAVGDSCQVIYGGGRSGRGDDTEVTHESGGYHDGFSDYLHDENVVERKKSEGSGGT